MDLLTENELILEKVTNKQEAQVKEKKGRHSGKKAYEMPDLNEVDESPMNSRSDDAEDTNVDTRGKKEETRKKVCQAAAEIEHVVVRGSNKGKDIVRTVVTDEDACMDLDEGLGMEEHHQDPRNDNANDVTMSELGDSTREHALRRGLDPGRENCA